MKRRKGAWVLIAALAVIVPVIFLAAQCSKTLGLESFVGVLATALVSFAWLNSKRETRPTYICLYAIWDLLIALLGMFLFFITISALGGNINCYTDRARATEKLAALSALKNAVSDYYLSERTLAGSDSVLGSVDVSGFEFIRVSNVGELLAFATDPEIFVLLTPVAQDTKLRWHCRVWPSKNAPSSCRE